MFLLNSSSSKLSILPGAAASLPIGTLVFKLDNQNRRTNVVDPNLIDAYNDFAIYLRTRTDRLSKKICEQWLNKVLPHPSNQINLNSVSLDTLYRDFLSRDSENNKLEYVKRGGELAICGTYFFVVWHFTVASAENRGSNLPPILNSNFRSYMRNFATNWSHKVGDIIFRIDTNYFFDVSKRGNIEDQLSVAQWVIGWQDNTSNNQNDGFISGIKTEKTMIFRVEPKQSEKIPFRKRQQATLSFVSDFCSSIQDVVSAELNALLGEIDVNLRSLISICRTIAVGDGSSTDGFFRFGGSGDTIDLGVLFFSYSLELPPNSNTISPKQRVALDLKVDEFGVPYDVFIAHWGANLDDGGQLVGRPCVTVKDKSVKLGSLTIGGPSDRNTGFFNQQTSLTNLVYSSENGLLSFDPRNKWSNLQIELANGPEEVPTNGDEIAFIVIQLKLPTLPTLPANTKLAADYLFDDNKFIVPTLWNTSAEIVRLTELVLAMRKDVNFGIVSSILGQGIGRRVDLGTDLDHNSDLVSANNQLDNAVANEIAVENNALRYAHGKIIWFPKNDGSLSQLLISTEGFVSPLRCTWSIWSEFSQHVSGTTTTKSDSMLQDIGQHLWGRPKGTPNHTQGPPSYNVALSAFRAFGIFCAIIKKIQDHVIEMGLDANSGLSSSEAQTIVAKLESYLTTKAKSQLRQVGLDRDVVDVSIDYNLFQKYK
jgi:hypothetical protein